MLKILVDGGFMMIPLVLFDFGVGRLYRSPLCISLERSRRCAVLAGRVMDALRSGNVEEAALLCSDTRTCVCRFIGRCSGIRQTSGFI